MLETSGPVPAFTDAVQARDVNRIAGLLAHDVRLSVPPLHYTRHGTHDVVSAMIGLLRSFDDLKYDVRSRYVAPGTVTDEALLVGRQTAPFLGAEPGRQLSTVAARVIVAHDSATITAITVWPDVAALRTAVGGTARVIDLTKVGDAGAMVARLRASIPPTHAKLIIGSAREQQPPAPPAVLELAVAGPGDSSPLAGRTIPKPPVPRTVRRRRALIAGSAMLVVSIALTLWVAIGALSESGSRPSPGTVELRAPGSAGADSAAGGGGADSAAGGGAAGSAAGGGATGAGSPGSGRAGDADRAGGAGAAGTGSAADAAAAASGPAGRHSTMADVEPSRLTADRTEVRFLSDVLFDTDSSVLKPQARALLDALIADARAQRRQGRVTVRGYTDNVGLPNYNLALSKRRAATVSGYLHKGLAGTGMTFTSRGYGMDQPAGPNDTPAQRQLNRRVTVVFPRAATPARLTTP